MERKLLVREIKAAALARMEDAARTTDDFKSLIKMWNHLDDNREHRVRYNEISRPNEEMLHWNKINPSDEKGGLRSSFGAVIPRPLEHPWWRQLIKGDFIDTIFDNPEQMWQFVEDCDISDLLKGLTAKQKIVVFLITVRQCTPQQIACYQNKTDRAVRKLMDTAINKIRDKLAVIINRMIDENLPEITLAKRQFLEWYEQQKIALDNAEGE